MAHSFRAKSSLYEGKKIKAETRLPPVKTNSNHSATVLQAGVVDSMWTLRVWKEIGGCSLRLRTKNLGRSDRVTFSFVL